MGKIGGAVSKQIKIRATLAKQQKIKGVASLSVKKWGVQSIFHIPEYGNYPEDYQGKIYYITPATSLAEVSAGTYAPGDAILFESTGVWRGALTIRNSGTAGNPIIFGAYGSTASKPVIDGADIISGMSSAGSNIWQKTGVTIQPYIMWLNDSIGALKNSVVACTSEGDWFWDSGTNVFYFYTTSGNPSKKVELGQRGILVDASNRNHITINNLTLQHSNNNNTIGYGSTRGALYMFNGSYLTVKGCTIQDNSLHGIHVINSSHITIDNNTLLRNGTMNWNGRNAEIRTVLAGTHPIGRYYTFTNNTSSYAGADGLMILSTNYAYPIKHITISGNRFEHNAAAGCYPINSDTTVIYNNYFESNGNATKTGEDYAIGVQSGSNIDIYNNTITNQLNNDAIQVWANTNAPSHNVRIFCNYISGVKNGDCIELIQDGDNCMQNAQIFYNVLDSPDLYGIVLSHNFGTLDSVDVFNNTIYGCGKSAIYVKNNLPAFVKNNIFSNFVDYGILATGTTGLTTLNNLWYRASGNVLDYGGVRYTATIIKTFEATAQTGDPLFTNAATGDFTLQPGSPAINAGVDVGLTHDILGNPIEGLPDIGAYEFIS